jgi:hypothetical protein
MELIERTPVLRKQVRGAGLKRHQTVATDRGVQWPGREFDWPDGGVANDRCGRFAPWARYCPITIRAPGGTSPLLTRVRLKHHGRGADWDLGLCSYATQWRPF